MVKNIKTHNLNDIQLKKNNSKNAKIKKNSLKNPNLKGGLFGFNNKKSFINKYICWAAHGPGPWPKESAPGRPTDRPTA